MNKNVYLLGLIIIIASVVLPALSVNSFGGDVIESGVVYRHGLFGPAVVRSTMSDGNVVLGVKYPWYYFNEYSTASMEIYGIQGTTRNDYIEIICRPDDNPIPIKFYEKNDLDFTDASWLTRRIADGKEVCSYAHLFMYEGYVTDPDHTFDDANDVVHDAVMTEGPFAYGDTWSATLNFYPNRYLWSNNDPGVYDFTVQEMLTPDVTLGSLIPQYTDRAFIDIVMLEDDTSITTGQITVTVFDNFIQVPAFVKMYKDGVLLKDVYIDGQFTFKDLEFGTYQFVVTDTDYEFWFYEASPQQTGFDNHVGYIPLSAERSIISYKIFGDFPQTVDDGFGKNESSWFDGILDGAWNPDGDDEDKEPGFMDLLKQIVEGLGLLTIVLIGLPIFIIIFVIIMLVGYIAGGKKQ